MPQGAGPGGCWAGSKLVQVGAGVPLLSLSGSSLTPTSTCPLQVSYAIGVSHPLSISIFHYGTSQKSERELLEIVKKNFDLRPGVIVR